MAKVYITEYSKVKFSKSGSLVQAAEEPPLATQTITANGTSQQSSAFNAETRFIRLHSDAIISFVAGSNPTATANSSRMPADTIEYFGVFPNHKIAVITNT